MDKSAQNKFLSDMYDDFFSLITSEAFKAARERDRKLKYNRDRIPKIDAIGSREELLNRAKRREMIQKETSQVKRETTSENVDIPEIEVKKKEEKQDSNEEKEAVVEVEEVLTEEQKQAKLQEFFDRVEEAHLTDESKLVLKKMIDYARKYKEGIVQDYIPFNMRLYTNDDETLYTIVNIIIDSFYYYDYMKNDEAV
jgi:hypothetical protein